MIVLDANLLLYAYDASSPHHLKARKWLEKVFYEGETIGLPWLTIQAFIRVSTNSRMTGNSITSDKAIEIVEDWLTRPNIRFLSPGESHWHFFRQMIIGGQVSGPLITDAALAALAIEHGGTIYSTDRDFARFPGLRWINPLEK